MADAISGSTSPVGQKIKFHYLKGNLFRIVHVDGALGGLTPSLDLFIRLYHQRAPIPQVTVQKMNENGQLGDEIMEERETKEGIIREVEIGLIMNVQTAKQLQKWLADKIQLVDKAQHQLAAEAQPKEDPKLQ
jgi:hypothetical protein